MEEERKKDEPLTMSEFARLLGNDEKYYENIEGGKKPPGRELLEAAAKLAGFNFEDCIRIPDESDPPHLKAIIDDVRAAFEPPERPPLRKAVLDFGVYLRDELAKPPRKRKKTGGRTRKNSKPKS